MSNHETDSEESYQSDDSDLNFTDQSNSGQHAQCDLRQDTDFKVSDLSYLSVNFQFCSLVKFETAIKYTGVS